MRRWARRAAALHDELAGLAELDTRDPRWWLVAGGAAVAWQASPAYVASDADPEGDTLVGQVAPAPHDLFADAVARAHAARATIRALDGTLPDQPLAVTVRRTEAGASLEPSALDVAAFAIGERCWCARLAARPGDDGPLAADLAGVLAGRPPQLLRPLGATATPFVTVSIGDEPLETARHGHRRGWLANGSSVGPWLGLGRAGGLAITSTCHLVVDGYGHARLATLLGMASGLTTPPTQIRPVAPPRLTSVTGSPLAITWRPIDGTGPRALPLGYALGRLLHRLAGRADARFSPTFQIPVAPGQPEDPERRRRRVVPAIASVRFEGGEAEPFPVFDARTREILRREALGAGLASRLLSAARAAPAPLAWKRRAVGPARPRWLASVADLIGGRGCVSRIFVDTPTPISCAVSSPSRLASASDPVGGCVVTVIDDGTRAAVTLCGSGRAAATDRLDELLALLP